MIYYGHTKEDPITKKQLPKEKWQLLKEHLGEVANFAEQRAKKFGAGKLGRILGIAHDLGKYSDAFQKRLEGAKSKVDHSTAGAKEVDLRFGSKVGRALAFCVSGHHGGLPDGNKGDPNNLPERLATDHIPDYAAFQSEIEFLGLNNQDLASMPHSKDPAMAAYSFAFCIRMLYSCLVDADYLDTERFMDEERFSHRSGTASLQSLLKKFEQKIQELAENNQKNPSKINLARQHILDRCLGMAEKEPGLFTLTVPTGGGKTYSSMAFGLKHAVEYEKDRIIYVIPYTSIIEQNAEVFREAIGDEFILEHHSNFEYPEGSFANWNEKEKTHRLATENWDMPIVVTTAVQFFESLYANKGSRCRKLHNMVNSVIVLDEAQTMPIEFLLPCLWSLAELVMNYGATVVLCTATQPAVRKLLPAGLKPTEIIEDPLGLQKLFQRVTVEYAGLITDDELVQKMSQQPQVLTIVNTRSHALILFDKLATEMQEDEDIFHLSTRMCPVHRKKALKEIRKALKENRPCRVVSTQLVEAGVDIDFPVVYRSAAGIDSVAQAAGRCNRNGKLPIGLVTIFDPEEPHGMPKKGRFSLVAGLTRSTLRRIDQFDNDILSLGAIEDFFHQLLDFEQDKLDLEEILKLIRESGPEISFPFKTIADKFQMIDSTMFPVIIPFDEKASDLMVQAEYDKFPARLSRSMQPYVVQVYQHELAGLEKEGAVRQVGDFFKFLIDRSFYDWKYGLKDAKEVKAPTETLIF